MSNGSTSVPEKNERVQSRRKSVITGILELTAKLLLGLWC